MISSLSGTIIHKELNSLVVDVAGVGYKIFVDTTTALENEIGSERTFWTHLAVRETSLDLFGFIERTTLEIFELLITVSGIGPKTALGILNVASPTTLRQAVANSDTSYLIKVSGLGKKTAEKIVRELEGKLVTAKDESGMGAKQARTNSDVLEALVSLGYSERDAREALKEIPTELESTSERVKHALKLLSNSK
jgi:holliday junction DNA helicase RuvA